jgi:hypothetical protein
VARAGGLAGQSGPPLFYSLVGQVQPWTWVAELTGMLDLGRLAGGDAGDGPQGSPHSGAQLRFADIDGIGSPPSTGRLNRAADRPGTASPPPDQVGGPDPQCQETARRGLPLHGVDENQIRCELAVMAQ